ncbi:4Fe-4S single cluster domain-containing protein [Hazenella coriacea]|uniref:Anaerobic ribonucleoside-triphosphate reductase activating protein n=1 Tax=Hazenella coriacea TaxID=1179467 RepID=A0A4R3LA59_9BACL|nr:4Fe-4S single cluster domain-containing protein [Hazenella coriacea]TCS96609.1 anaerobic ribonucleoside-triphosphate reductase activating protein [Hazenella coriacea]
MKLRIHRFLPTTTVEGPGVRACIWVQGCPIHCKGCAVPWTWSPNHGQEVEVEQLARQILEEPEIEGVTFVGGEPFEQAEALSSLGKILKSKGLSVVTFSGYEYKHLQSSQRQDWQDLLTVTDLLIDGPFKQELLDLARPWVGSSNQQYRFLTDRYKYLENQLQQIPNKIEVRLNPDGQIEINGMASQQMLHQLFEEEFYQKRSQMNK